jgi:hypothetical protein
MNIRPKGVLIVAIIMLFAAIMALIVGISTFIPGTPLDIIWTLNNSFPQGFTNSLMGIIFGIFIFTLGLIILSTVWGLLKGLKWAWWITIIIFILNALGDLFRLTLGGFEGIFGILIAAGFLYYLNRPNVKAFFENKSKSNAS